MTLTPEQIKAIRQRLGMTQVQLAAELQVTIDAIKHWETGRRRCTGPAEVLLRLLDKQAKGEG